MISMDLKQQILHLYRVDEMSLAGGKALQGACAPPRKGRGTGPVGYKFPKGTQETMGGAGVSEANEVPPVPYTPTII